MPNPSDYLLLFSDCVPVKGAVKSVIVDVGRRDLYEIGNDYFELIERFEQEKYEDVLALFSQDELADAVAPFVDFLVENELAHFHSNKDNFPKIQFEWDDYALITNAIIDIRGAQHDTFKLLSELDELGTKHVQFRYYRSISFSELTALVDQLKTTNLYSTEIIAEFSEANSIPELENYLRQHPIVTMLTFTSSPENKMHKVFIDPNLDEKIVVSKILYTQQPVTSCESCGIINMRNMVVPQMKEFSEAKNFNSCLNRKIAVDENGFIKNCPSMTKHYGHHKDVHLFEALNQAGFKDVWKSNKDQIATCKSCEYRYICTDCRAYVEDPQNMLSKPLKCNYDPFSGTWTSDTREESIQATTNAIPSTHIHS